MTKTKQLEELFLLVKKHYPLTYFSYEKKDMKADRKLSNYVDSPILFFIAYAIDRGISNENDLAKFLNKGVDEVIKLHKDAIKVIDSADYIRAKIIDNAYKIMDFEKLYFNQNR